TRGGCGTTPGWCCSETHNSITTNSQQDSYTTHTIPIDASDHRQVAVERTVPRDQASAVEADALWRAVLAQVRQTMTPTTYDRWFAPTIGMQLDGNDLTVEVPTEMHHYWLNVRIRQRIDDTLQLLRYTDVRVTFTIAIHDNQATCTRAESRKGPSDHTRRRHLP